MDAPRRIAAIVLIDLNEVTRIDSWGIAKAPVRFRPAALGGRGSDSVRHRQGDEQETAALPKAHEEILGLKGRREKRAASDFQNFVSRFPDTPGRVLSEVGNNRTFASSREIPISFWKAPSYVIPQFRSMTKPMRPSMQAELPFFAGC